jgi:hypothetical protein
MKCEICQFESENSPCSTDCTVLATLASVQALYDAAPSLLGEEQTTNERNMLRWQFRKRWHEARGLKFEEQPPEPLAELEMRRMDLLREE